MTRTSPALLLEPEQLGALLTANDNDLLILDVSSSENYAKHHIPGAIHIEPKALQSGKPPVPGKLPDEEQLTALFSAVGLTPERHVIAYDDEGGGWAGRLIWTLDVLGHQHYSYLNGGLTAWVNEGFPRETTVNNGSPSNYKVSINRDPIAEIEDIVPLLGSEQLAIWDARTIAEYNGTKVLAQRGGHIPGAVNLDWLDLMDKQHNLRLLDLRQLQQQLNDRGITSDKTVITHCQTHHRSGLSYLLMKILGYQDIKGYHGSWSEWGNREDTPVE